MREKQLYVLIVNIYGSKKNIDLLDDKKEIRLVAERVMKICKMKQLAKPTILKVIDKDSDKGITLFLPITTSSITMHTFCKRGQLNLIVHTCKKISEKQINKIVILTSKKFEPTNVRWKHIREI
ncbi:MAG: S-adenosylmethionine decarboxylase proenzyme [candidate division WS2 bacterium]|nr:S-adenosylmethionine decarboxylase proenzyme [Candidatus Lithacetigena glycinireducens]